MLLASTLNKQCVLFCKIIITLCILLLMNIQRVTIPLIGDLIPLIGYITNIEYILNRKVFITASLLLIIIIE